MNPWLYRFGPISQTDDKYVTLPKKTQVIRVDTEDRVQEMANILHLDKKQDFNLEKVNPNIYSLESETDFTRNR